SGGAGDRYKDVKGALDVGRLSDSEGSTAGEGVAESSMCDGDRAARKHRLATCDQTVGSGGDYAAGRLHRMPMVAVGRGALAASTLAAVVERRSRDCSRCDPLPIAFEGWSVAMALSLLSHQRAGWGARRQLLFEDVMRGSLQGHKEDHTWELESGRLQDEEGVGCRRLRVREMESDAESQQKRRGTRL
ncbi:hypothetical protein GW17_00060288, partial [Ensete ventricosum]